MKTLLVQTFEGERVGTVTQEAGGTLEVHGETPEYENALQELIDALTATPIPYRTGKVKKSERGVEYVTVVKRCHKSDPEFLNALKDILPRYSISGKRIRGILLQQ